ncbi:MAG: 2-phospho-L-lactate guanylyltransferase [Solirubrobacteraceae bacterium]
MRTAAILPMKAFKDAKQRLAATLGAGHRRALVEAMYSDVLVAARRTSMLDAIFVVTGDRAVARIAEQSDATVIDDTGASHSEAARLGIEQALAGGFHRVLLIPGDCPLLDPAQLDALLARPVDGGERSALVIPDRHGTGTNGLLLSPPDALTPAFGLGSCRRHMELAADQGATSEVVEVPTLGLDIDTPEDLDTLRRTLASTRGGAAHTRGMIRQLDRTGAR